MQSENKQNGQLEVESSTTNKPDIILDDNGIVKKISLTKFVELITSENYVDFNYLLTFFLTYRAFTTPNDFLEMLKQRFWIAPPSFQGDDYNHFIEKVQRPIRFRVASVLKYWATNHFYDLELDNQLQKSITQFLDVIESSGIPIAAQVNRTLKAKIEGITKKDEFILDPDRTPEPLHPVDISSISFDEIEPKEVARQMCIVEQKMYRAIRPSEYLNQAWTHKTLKETAAPNIWAMIHRFNLVVSFVVRTIVNCENLEERAKKIERFIEIAQHLRDLCNFHSVQEILSGLSATSVYRLKKTWAMVDPKLLEAFKSLETLMNSDRHYQAYRSALFVANPPVIPYLGMHLLDLTFIVDSCATELDDGLINFAKWRRIATVIAEIQQYQYIPYELQPIPAIINLLRDGLQGLDETLVYSMSLKLESRGSNTAN